MTFSDTSAAPWRSLQVRYYDQTKDDLLLDGVRPVLDALAPLVDRPYFVRHWRRGPHVQLNFQVAEGRWERRVLPFARRKLTAYLRDHPSRTVLDERIETERHQRMAVDEQVRGPLSPWYPDNTVQCEPYDDRLHILGSPELVDLLGTCYAESSALAFTMLERVRAGRAHRIGAALDLMFAFAHVSVPPISRGFMSYWSHSEGFLGRCARPDQVRAQFDAVYERRRAALRTQLETVLDALEGTGEQPFVREWVRLTRRHKAFAEPLLASGRITLDHATPDPGDRPVPDTPLEELGANPSWQREVFDSLWFRSHRLAINLLYGHLYRLGISPKQRFLLCYLARRTVEDVFGVSAEDRARQYVADHPHPSPAH